MVSQRSLSAQRIALIDVTQVYAQDCSLETVHARIPAQLVMVVANAHAVLAQHPRALGQFRIVGCDHACVARRIEIFCGIKAEGSYIAQTAGFGFTPARAPGLRCVLHQRQPKLLRQRFEVFPYNALSVKVNGQYCRHRLIRQASQQIFRAGGIEIEADRVNIAQQGSAAGAHNTADGSKKAERSSDNRPILNLNRSKRKPQSVCTRGAADGVLHSEIPACALLKSRNGIAQDELTAIDDLGERLHDFCTDRNVLAFQIEHWNRLRSGMRSCTDRRLGRQCFCRRSMGCFGISHVASLSMQARSRVISARV